MKHLFYILFISIALLPLKAQEFDAYLTAGINGAQVDGDGLGGFNKPGLKAGFGLLIPGKKVGTNLEIAYSHEGSRSVGKQIEEYDRIHLRFHYIDFSALVDWNFYEGFHFYGGVQIGYFLSGENENEGSFTSFDGVIKKIDLSPEIGISYRINEKWEVLLRYNRSLPSVHKQLSYRNNVLSLTARLYLN